MKRLASIVFWMRRGESKEENQQVRLDTTQKLLKLKIVKEGYSVISVEKPISEIALTKEQS